MQQAVKGIRQEFLPLPNEETPADGKPVFAKKSLQAQPQHGVTHGKCGIITADLARKCWYTEHVCFSM